MNAPADVIEMPSAATCDSCPSFKAMDSVTGECRYKPPVGVIIPVTNALGEQQMAVQTFYPRVQNDSWCSYHPVRYLDMGGPDEESEH